MRGTNEYPPAIGLSVVEPPWDGNTARIRSEIVVFDQNWRALPSCPGVLEAPDQLSVFGVDADSWPALALKALARPVDVLELLITKGAGFARDLLVIDTQRELQAPE